MKNQNLEQQEKPVFQSLIEKLRNENRTFENGLQLIENQLNRIDFGTPIRKENNERFLL